MSGSLTINLCVQPASAFTRPYLSMSSFDPVVAASFGSAFELDVGALVLPSAGASVANVTGRSGAPLASWLTYDSTLRLVRGLPSGSIRGDYLVDVRFAANGTAKDLVTLVVRVRNTAPVYTPLLAVVRVGVGREVIHLSSDFVDAEGDALTFSLSSAPAFVSVAGDSLTVSSISGDQGNYTLSVMCVDVFGATSVVTLTLVVENAAPARTETVVAPADVEEGSALWFSFPQQLMSDPDGDIITYSATLPAFLSLNSSTRVVSGTPGHSDVGVHAITISGHDGHGAVTHVQTSVVVLEVCPLDQYRNRSSDNNSNSNNGSSSTGFTQCVHCTLVARHLFVCCSAWHELLVCLYLALLLRCVPLCVRSPGINTQHQPDRMHALRGRYLPGHEHEHVEGSVCDESVRSQPPDRGELREQHRTDCVCFLYVQLCVCSIGLWMVLPVFVVAYARRHACHCCAL